MVVGPMNPPRPWTSSPCSLYYYPILFGIINEEIPLSANSSAMPGVNIRTSAMYVEGGREEVWQQIAKERKMQ